MDELWCVPEKIVPKTKQRVVSDKEVDFLSDPSKGGIKRGFQRKFKVGDVYHTAGSKVEIVSYQGGTEVNVKVLDTGAILTYNVRAIFGKVKEKHTNMMQLQTTTAQGTDVVTMTSIELVNFINEVRKNESGYILLRHDNFMSKVPKVLGESYAPKFLGTQRYGNNNSRSIYNLPKREATLMAMSYSHEISAQVYDKMEELERQVKGATPQFNIPQSFSEALLLAANQAKVIEEQAKTLTIQAPKVQFHNEFVNHDGCMTATDIAKKLGISAIKLNKWLVENDALYRRRTHFKSWYIEKGYGVEKFTEVLNGSTRHVIYHTNKGADWILANYRSSM